MERRTGALFINLFLLACISGVIHDNISAVGNPLFYCVWIFLFLFFSLFPESPGKRVLNIKILDADQNEIKIGIRILRCSPYLIFSTSQALALLSNAPLYQYVYQSVYLLSLLFIIVNAVAVILLPSSLSLLDLILKTQVMVRPSRLKPSISRGRFKDHFKGTGPLDW